MESLESRISDVDLVEMFFQNMNEEEKDIKC